MLSSPFFFPDRRHRALLIICLLIGFLLLGLTRSAFAVMCSFTGAPSPWVSHPQYYFTKASAESACQSFAAQVGKICNGPYSCAGKDTGDCSWRAGYVEYWVDIVNFSLNPHTYDQYQFLYCADTLIDTDGDGIPDSTDPCPNNPNPDCIEPDTDGDGIPDSQDPCPNNPNPDCTDPNNPPPDLPPTPEFPDEIVIGDCVIDISEITSIFKAEGGVFPINWIVAFGSALRTFTQVQASEAPSIQYSFSFFGKSYEIDLHLERFNSIASCVRFVSGLLAMFYFIRFANRGFFKVITGSGT